jgi:hypothetical protein
MASANWLQERGDAALQQLLGAVGVVEREHGRRGDGVGGPRLAGWSGFPSTRVGRPWWFSARTPSAYPPSSTAVA